MALFKVSEPEEVDMSFWEHLDALRPRIMRSAVALFAFMVIAFIFGGKLMEVITGPMSEWFPTNRLFAWLAEELSSEVLRINSNPVQLINTAMAGQFNLHLSIAFHTALLLVIPLQLRLSYRCDADTRTPFWVGLRGCAVGSSGIMRAATNKNFSNTLPHARCRCAAWAALSHCAGA